MQVSPSSHPPRSSPLPWTNMVLRTRPVSEQLSEPQTPVIPGEAGHGCPPPSGSPWSADGPGSLARSAQSPRTPPDLSLSLPLHLTHHPVHRLSFQLPVFSHLSHQPPGQTIPSILWVPVPLVTDPPTDPTSPGFLPSISSWQPERMLCPTT